MRNVDRLLMTGLAAVLCGATAAADAPQPAAVATALKDIASMCTDAGGKPLTDKAVQRADLNGDGKEDYVLDVGPSAATAPRASTATARRESPCTSATARVAPSRPSPT